MPVKNPKVSTLCRPTYAPAMQKPKKKKRKCANCGLTTHGAAYAGCSVFRQYKVKIELENIRLKEEWARYVDRVETARNPRHETPKTNIPPSHTQTHRTYALEPSLMHLIRCNNCQVFGHSAKKCRSKTPKYQHRAGPYTHQQ